MTTDETRRAQIQPAAEYIQHLHDCPAIGGNGDVDCRCGAVQFLAIVESQQVQLSEAVASLARLSEAQQQLDAIDKAVPRRRESPDVPLVERVVQAVVQMQYDDERCRTWEAEAETARAEVARLSEAQQQEQASSSVYRERVLPLLRGELRLRQGEPELASLLRSAILRIEELSEAQHLYENAQCISCRRELGTEQP